MADGVNVSVKSDLDKIIADLGKIRDAGVEVQQTLGSSGKAVGEEMQKTVKNTQTMVERVGGFSRGFVRNLMNDFKTLASVNMLKSGLQLNDMFRGTLKQSASLSDNIRKLGPVFGIAQKGFAGFQASMVKGLGEVGISSDAAVNALQGLADTPVRGEKALIEYSKTAGQLAQLSGTTGQEGEIASGIARVIRARGGDANNTGEMSAVAEDIRRTFNAVGKAPAEVLQDMESLFSSMPEDLRKKIGTRGVASITAASAAAGPGAMDFMKEFLGKSPIARMAMEQQGFKGVIGDKGLDMKKFQTAAAAVLKRIGGDPRMAAKTLGLSEEAAEGFVRMAKSGEQMTQAQRKVQTDGGNINDQQRGSMGLKEAFEGNVNRVKSLIAEPLAGVMDGLTNMLGGAGESTAGALGVVGGGAALAALLTGQGIQGLGSSLMKNVLGSAKSKALENLTGEKVTSVFVTNTEDFPGGANGGMPSIPNALGGAAGGGKLGKVAKVAGKALAVAGVAAAAYEVGGLASDLISEGTQGTTKEGFKGDLIERGIQKVGRNLPSSLGGDTFRSMENPPPKQKVEVSVKVDLNKKDLKGSKPKTRGASN